MLALTLVRARDDVEVVIEDVSKSRNARELDRQDDRPRMWM